MPLTRIKPQGLDSTGTYTFNGIIANSAIVAGNEISSGGGSGGGPKITNIQVTNNSYTVLDDTSVSTSGGFIKITGTGFAAGCQVLINNTPVTSVTFVSATEVRAQVPATTAGTYIVYLVNSDGGVAIRVNGITFSGTPNWVTSSTLPNSEPLVSIQLSATSDSVVVYSLAAGSTLPTGITLSSGGLLSGTVTGTTVETIYNFTINAIDAELQESSRAFSITITFGDPNFPYVTTLLSATALTLPFNNDASNNNFAVTVFGDTRPNNFGPYTPGYYSNYFDGTGDYLATNSTLITNFGAGLFTIESWVYFNSVSGTQYIMSTYQDSGTGWALGLFNSKFNFWSTGDGPDIVGTTTPVINTWYHLAVSGQTGSIKLFVNGIQEGSTYTGATALNSTSTLRVGDGAGAAAGQALNGYLDDVRITRGAARYTANFTPTTLPFITK